MINSRDWTGIGLSAGYEENFFGTLKSNSDKARVVESNYDLHTHLRLGDLYSMFNM